MSEDKAMQIIIVGCGKVGMTLAEQLSRESHDITVIDVKEEAVQRATALFDVQGVIGNGASVNVQMEAGIEKADLIIAVTHSDELNLLCCLIARKAGNVHTIARVRNPIYSKENRFIKEELGLSMIINPEYAAAEEMARLLRFPSAIEIDVFAKGRIELLTFRISETSILNGYRVMDIATKLHCDVLVCSVERGDEVFIPSGNFVMQEKDTISFIAAPQASTAFFKKIGIETNQVHNTMIVGGGETCYYLAYMLLGMGIHVKIVEKQKERCEELSELLPDAMIIYGDGTDKDLLLEEGLNKMESFVALTNIDEENILLTLYAKSQTKGKFVTKVNSISFDEIIHNLNLDSIIYPKYITAEYILQYVRAMQNSIGSNIETLYKLCDEKVEALEFYIKEDSPIVDIPLEELKLKDNLLICCINHRNQIRIPRGQDRICKGDSVVVVTTQKGLQDIKDILA